uniref:Uncharacterized protein n=1 Tax=Athene cunicularia TaxID=194338 RepID=A0A663N737_ATHCN
SKFLISFLLLNYKWDTQKRFGFAFAEPHGSDFSFSKSRLMYLSSYFLPNQASEADEVLTDITYFYSNLQGRRQKKTLI